MPQLFEKLGIAIKSVAVARPTLDDVFLNFTGTSLRDAESKGGKRRNGRTLPRGR